MEVRAQTVPQMSTLWPASSVHFRNFLNFSELQFLICHRRITQQPPPRSGTSTGDNDPGVFRRSSAGCKHCTPFAYHQLNHKPRPFSLISTFVSLPLQTFIEFSLYSSCWMQKEKVVFAASGKLDVTVDRRWRIVTHCDEHLNRNHLKGWWAGGMLGKALRIHQSAQGGDTLGKEKTDKEPRVEGLQYKQDGAFSLLKVIHQQRIWVVKIEMEGNG